MNMEKFVTQIKIILSVFGDVFDPENLTQKTGISPTAYWKKGDIIPPIKGLRRKSSVVSVRKESAWNYSTGFIQTLFFEQVSEVLINSLGGRIMLLKDYVEKENLDIKIYVVIEIADEHKPALYFDKKFLKMVNELEAEIDVDLYILNNRE